MTITKKLAPSTYEGWRLMAERPQLVRPEWLSHTQISALDASERRKYDGARRTWHARILLRTPQVKDVHEQLWELLDSNLQDFSQVRGAAAIDSPPSLGKSTAVDTFGYEFHNAQIEEFGKYVDGDDEDTLRLPVCRIRLMGDISIKGLHFQLDHFYAHPATAPKSSRGSLARDLAVSASEAVLRHETSLIIIDDIHFLSPNTEHGEKVANELKWLANEYPATFVFAGVGLKDRGLFSEGRTPKQAALAQTGRRWTLLKMDPFDPTTAVGAAVWRDTLLAIEQRLILARLRPGTLESLSDYLYIRSTGVIGSLMQLMNRGSSKAIRTGEETLSQKLLDTIRIDEAAEAARGWAANRLMKSRASASTD